MINEKTGFSQAFKLICQQASPTGSMQVCFSKADVYTIQFEVSSVFQVPGQSGQITFADITWSVNGTNVKRSVSVCSGTSISGVGEAVLVRVYDGSPPGSEVGIGAPDPASYTVTVNIAKGLRGAQSQ